MTLLPKAGRQRNLPTRATQIVAALRSEQLPVRTELEGVNAATVSALVAVLTTMVAQTAVLEEQLRWGFGQHPDAEIYLSQPGLGMILGARVLAEMGDDPGRYADARARKNDAGWPRSPAPQARNGSSWPATPATGGSPMPSTNKGFAALTASPGARACYDRHRAAGATHHQALRTLANRLVGILHGCLRTSSPTTRTPPGPPAPQLSAMRLDTLQPWDV